MPGQAISKGSYWDEESLAGLPDSSFTEGKSASVPAAPPPAISLKNDDTVGA